MSDQDDGGQNQELCPAHGKDYEPDSCTECDQIVPTQPRRGMSVHITTLNGDITDEAVEVWASDYGAGDIWLVYEDDALNERIDLSVQQLRELIATVEWV